MSNKKINSALISVFYKDGLENVVQTLHNFGVTIYTTGGTQTFIEALGIPVHKVEDLTGYPSILGGRVKTLHPKVFSGILAKRNEDHLSQLVEYNIPEMDLVIVDLYPFEETVKSGCDHAQIIEKIDIGGVSLIRAAAKNYEDVAVVSSKEQYGVLVNELVANEGALTLEMRSRLSAEAFMVTSHYDTSIQDYMASFSGAQSNHFKTNIVGKYELRYGENPHQKASFYGDLDAIFEKLCGKELSFNNLVDVDAAMALMQDVGQLGTAFAILKHTNSCGVGVRQNVREAWKAALAADPQSAFGGILITNGKVDGDAAKDIDSIFYEVLIAPDFSEEALLILKAKPNRILLKSSNYTVAPTSFKSILNGVIEQAADTVDVESVVYTLKSKLAPSSSELEDLKFANICVKHLKSNAIVLVKDQQLIGMGCGQTSRIDACRNAIEKAQSFGFDLNGAVMASDAFFPFPDCVQLVAKEGIKAIVQPGGSIKDQLSIDYCDEHGLSMVFTGLRHFKH